jgi:hypothetical protein
MGNIFHSTNYISLDEQAMMLKEFQKLYGNKTEAL